MIHTCCTGLRGDRNRCREDFVGFTGSHPQEEEARSTQRVRQETHCDWFSRGANTLAERSHVGGMTPTCTTRGVDIIPNIVWTTRFLEYGY